ncbi:hypothetical protein [Ideonella sp. BN130291]|uniref:hypothetical protein n=1 Tax=Ideonella sp. BN130291 TaxID=3112940 RepID=UPI002E27148B|nr:hypothetical protein [Ideonella sp. BN130291]
MEHLKRYLVVVGTCAIATVVLTLFAGRSVPSLINIGSYVGALCLLLGAWRLMNGSNDAIDHVHMIQRVQNFDAEIKGRPALHQQIVPMFVAPGALFFAGLTWLVLLQAIRYKWGIVLD